MKVYRILTTSHLSVKEIGPGKGRFTKEIEFILATYPIPFWSKEVKNQAIMSISQDSHKFVGLKVLVSLLFLCLSHNLAQKIC